VIEAGVLRDLVDPGLERDLAVVGAQIAQGRHERVLDDVLRPRVVRHDPAHISGDPIPVSPEERFERSVAALLRSDYELVIRGLGRRSDHQWFHRVSLTSYLGAHAGNRIPASVA